MMKNYYIALQFVGRPDLHMTLGYFKDLEPIELSSLINEVNNIGMMYHCEPFIIKLDAVAYHGSKRVLLINSWPRPSWIIALTDIDTPKKDKTYNIWVPHITCRDKELLVQAEAVTIMHRKTEIARWNLKW